MEIWPYRNTIEEIIHFAFDFASAYREEKAQWGYCTDNIDDYEDGKEFEELVANAWQSRKYEELLESGFVNSLQSIYSVLADRESQDVYAWTIAMRIEEDPNWKNAAVCVDLVTLDSIIEKRNLSCVDYIKIDAEGAELRVLQGAYKTIKRNHPILAVACYHRFSDIVSLIQMILDIDVNYKIYISARENKPIGQTIIAV